MDRLEEIRDSEGLKLWENGRATIDEAIDLLHRMGWDEYDHD